MVELACSDHQVPQRLKFLPSRSIEEVLGLVLERAMMQRGTRNGSPSIKLTIGPVVSGFQNLGLELRRPINDMSGVVEIPVARQHTSFTQHASMQLSTRIGRLNMEGCGGDAMINSPIY